MTDLETILSWFQTGDIPTEEEFRQTFSSFRHKNTKIPIEEVDRLESLLNSKINSDDYIKDGKIRADKIEALGLTELIEASEKDISEFAENSDKYEFQQNDFIAIPNEEGNFSLYLFKGGEKRDKSNYLSTGVSNGGEPLFLVSPAYNITQANINNWNAPETDPVFTASPAHSITQADIDLWNQGADAIPLSGTTADNPVTGNIQMNQQTVENKIYIGDLESEIYTGIKFTWDNEVVMVDQQGSMAKNYVRVGGGNAQMAFENQTESKFSSITASPDESAMRFSNLFKSSILSVGNEAIDFIVADATPNSDNYNASVRFANNGGLLGNKDFSSTYDEFSFVQKQYVDSKLTGLYKIKGSVANYDTLVNYIAPYAVAGDVYNTLDTGDNYVWVDNLNNTGAAGWDKLAGTINIDGLIPLTGTKSNQPLVGPIQFAPVNTIKAFYAGNLGQRHAALVFKDEGEVNLISSISSDEDSKISIKKNFLELKTKSADEAYNSNLSMLDSGVFISAVDIYNNRNALFSVDSSSGVTMTGLANATGDETFTRQLVQKEDGTLGYIENGFESGKIDSFGQFPGDSISGICTYEYQKGSKYVTVRLKIYIYLGTEDGNPHEVWINVPFGLGYTQQRIFDAFTGDSAIMTTQLNQISFMKTTRESMGVNIAACYTFPYGAEAGDD